MTSIDRDALEPLLRLHLTDEIGPVTLANLLDRFGSPAVAVEAGRGQLEAVPGIGRKTAERIIESRATVDVQRELDLIEEHGVRVLTPSDPDYPANLRVIADPPQVLYVQGALAEHDAVSVGVVGSRRCTRYGFEQAERFGHLLARSGMTVVSGMARGIDAAAHRGALAGGGRTVAVLGCGLANTYPPEHAELREQIAASGAVVSEFPMRVEPEGRNFPRRNRIIAGMSLGVLVVEAASRSGALITARYAMEYNREVFALPGRIDSPFSQGPHALLRDGAKLTECLDDILDELGETGRALRPEDADPLADDVPLVRLSEPETKLLGAMDSEPRGFEELAGLAGLPLPEVISLATQLQLKGQVSQVPGQLFIRRGRK